MFAVRNSFSLIDLCWHEAWRMVADFSRFLLIALVAAYNDLMDHDSV
jgi:hypothetical protein